MPPAVKSAVKPSADIAKARHELLALTDLKIRKNWPALHLALDYHRTDKNLPMDFGKYPAQVQFLKDASARGVIMKCVQVGVSECLVIKSIAAAFKGWSVLYSLPTEHLRDAFVSDRVDKSIRNTALYRYALKHSSGSVDQRGLKHIGPGTIRFVGSNSEVAFITFAADMIIIDEKDKSAIDNLKMAPDRLRASEHKFDWRVGNPSYPKYGIHADYLESDQKEWQLACQYCGAWQSLDFYKNVVAEIAENRYELLDREWTPGCSRDINLHCHKCGQPLDRFSDGQWVADNPGSQISGYHFTQLFSPTVQIREIWADFQKAQNDSYLMQLFYNSDLGLPYSAAGESLTAALLDAKAKHDYLMPSAAKDCTMGVDVGSRLHVRISDYPGSNARRAVYIGAVDWDNLPGLIERYDVRTCVIDSKPELRKAIEFRDAFPRIVWLCDYLTERSMDFWTVDDQDHTVKVQRTASIDGMIAGFLNGSNHLPSNFRSIDEYVAHMEAPKRKRDESGSAVRYIWDEEGKPDHFFHAENYDQIAMQLKKEIGDLMPMVTFA